MTTSASIAATCGSGRNRIHLSFAYLLKYVRENARSLTIGSVAIFIAITVTEILSYQMFGSYRYQTSAPSVDPMWATGKDNYIFFFFITAAIYGSMTFSSMKTPRSRMSTIMVPVSQATKTMTWFTVYGLGFLAVYMLSFFLADAARVICIRLFTDYGDKARLIPATWLLANGQDITVMSSLLEVLIIYLSIGLTHALFAAGSITFHRYSLIKTGIFLFVLQIVLTLTFFLSAKIFFPNGFRSVAASDDATTATHIILVLTIGILTIAAVWSYSYLRLKDSETIDRW